MTKNKVTAFILAIALMVAGAASCGGDSGNGTTKPGSSTSFPLTYVDSKGRSSVINAKPERIVSIAPNVTETLFAIGANPLLVGRCQYCDYPQAALAIDEIGSMTNYNVEKILELNPDIIFVTGMTSLEQMTVVEQAGIPIICFEYEDVDSLYKCIGDLGMLTGCETAATELVNSLKSGYDTLMAKVANVEKKKVFVDLGYYYSSNKDYFLGKNLNSIAINIAYDQPNGMLSEEYIIQTNPDVYICLSSEDEFLSHMPEAFKELSAFKTGQVFYFPYDDAKTGEIARQGPRYVDGLNVMFGLIYEQ